MQRRGFTLAIMLGVLVFSISGIFPTAFAEQIQLNQNSCENVITDGVGDTLLDLQGTWSNNRCTIDTPIELGMGVDPDTDEPVLDEITLFVPGTITLELGENSDLYLLGFILNDGNIENLGTIQAEVESAIINNNEFDNSGDMFMDGLFTGSGNLINSGNMELYAEFDVTGTITNSGNILSDLDFRSGSLFTNTGTFQSDSSSGFRNVENFGDFINNGSLDIAGFESSIAIFRNNIDSTFTNTGSITIDPSGEIDNIEGFVTGTGSSIEVAGKFTNHNLFVNDLSSFSIKHSGLVINLGNFNNDGIMTFNSNDGGFATFDGTQDVSTSFVNNNIIIDQCGKIFGPFTDLGTYTDQCDVIVTIDSPQDDASFSDQDDVIFVGSATDVFLNGTIVDYTAYLEWKNGGTILGTGSPITAQFPAIPPVHNIKANSFDEFGNPILDSNGEQIHEKVKIHIGIVDADGDGFAPESVGGEDCNDSDPTINPDATEIIGDGIDQDCDGVDAPATDADGDGFFIDYGTQLDCNDDDVTIFPGAPEIIGDGIDQDCDGSDTAPTDADGDGFLVSDGDCNDNDPTVYPGAPELIDGQDNSCDGILSEFEIDADFDGFVPGDENGEIDENGWDGEPVPLGGGDCNDIFGEGENINPMATEIPNGIDDDCDGVIPLNEFDEDNDGSTADLDCNESDDSIYPGAPEIIDGKINDCNSLFLPSNEIDDDLDGYIDGIFDPSGWDGYPIDMGDGDCIDNLDPISDTTLTGFDVNPGAIEVSDGIDNNCDGILLLEEIDNDGDGQAEFQGDCDDTSNVAEFVFLGNTEEDDGFDNNCDGIIDEGFDEDGDGFSITFDGDCDDSNPDVYPGAPEIFNDNIDNDCDGLIDNFTEKFATPHLQENLSDKTVRDYEKQVEDLEEEIEDLQKDNRKLDKKAGKYEAKAEDALEGDSERAAKYQEKSDKYEDKANEALEDGKERKATKYEKKSDYFQAKADKALEGDSEKAAKYQAKADKLRAEIASNESLIEMYGKEILVIDMSIGNIAVDWSQTIIVSYDNLTEDATHDILHEIKDNRKDMEKLEEKAVKYDKKADEQEAKGNLEKAQKYRLKAIEAHEEIEIIEDLNTVLECAIDFTEDMLPVHGNDDD